MLNQAAEECGFGIENALADLSYAAIIAAGRYGKWLWRIIMVIVIQVTVVNEF
jgi:hypothetical protein